MDTDRSDPREPLEAKPLVVLGGSGFIGTRLAALLKEQRAPFRIGDLRPSEAFPDLWTECDVRRGESLSEIVQGADAIINLAAAHRDDVRPLSLYHETNVQGAEQVCQAARGAGIRKIVFTSSVAVYGFQPVPVDESGPFTPFNEYGKTKLQAEGVYRAWAAEDPGRGLVMVRPTVVFGEGNRGNVYNLLHQVASGRFLMVGPGKNIKSMAYVENIAAFLIHVLALGPGTHTFNYVDGPDMDMNTLVAFIRGCVHQQGRLSRIPKPVALAGGHLLDAVARLTGRTFSISAIRVRKFCESTQFLADRVVQSGFVPPYSLREGLARTIQFEFPAK
jgi:nucleoside-diphosphate-sugar epimerase